MNNKVVKKGIMVCGHGSRDKDAEMEFSLVAEGLKKNVFLICLLNTDS